MLGTLMAMINPSWSLFPPASLTFLLAAACFRWQQEQEASITSVRALDSLAPDRLAQSLLRIKPLKQTCQQPPVASASHVRRSMTGSSQS
jgi:hypothetical protein